MSIEAMKQALEALEFHVLGFDQVRKMEIAIQALEQAIEQAEKQEPFGYFQLDLRMDAWVQNRDNKKGVPFYITPPKRKFVELTEDEIIGHTCECVDDGTFNMDCAIDFANSMQEALKRYNT